jgi:hypothetical protein
VSQRVCLEIARAPAIMTTAGPAMSFVKHTIAISRADLTRDCLQQVRLWPGCETVQSLGVLADSNGRFTVHVLDHGIAKTRIADRAIRCIQREKLRRYHLKPD